jgi:hypothetical protein
MKGHRLVEFRSYRLKPGAGPAFHALVSQESAPLHAAVQMDVVGYGPSALDTDAYLLVRSYENPEHLRSSQDSFYASDAWRKGPREAIVALIASDHDVVMWLPSEAVEALRLGLRCSASAI